MKTTNFIAMTFTAAVMATATPARAADEAALPVTADALIVRPVCLVATVVGSTVFVLGLPFAALSKSVRSSAHLLVVQPARATFNRPMGDFDFLGN